VQSVTTSLIAFTSAAALLTITPGLDTALVVRTGAAEGSTPSGAGRAGHCDRMFHMGGHCGRRSGGIARGLSPGVFDPSLDRRGIPGVRGISDALAPRIEFVIGQGRWRAGRAAFARGAGTNLLNPKVGIFYVSFLPQFIPNGMSVPGFTLLLGAIHALLGVAWFACLLGAMRPLTALLRRSSVVKGLDRATGATFIAFGIGLAVQSRRT
jgi:threonine/homoserine/homoserine lactone efflux protein